MPFVLALTCQRPAPLQMNASPLFLSLTISLLPTTYSIHRDLLKKIHVHHLIRTKLWILISVDFWNTVRILINIFILKPARPIRGKLHLQLLHCRSSGHLSLSTQTYNTDTLTTFTIQMEPAEKFYTRYLGLANPKVNSSLAQSKVTC